MKRTATFVLSLAVVVGIFSAGAGRVGAQSSDSNWFFLQLADPQLGAFTGDEDFVQETANFEFAIATANRLKPAFVVVTGDLVNKSGDEAQIAEYHRIVAMLDPDIPLYNVAGNHDVENVPTPDSVRAYRKGFGPDYYSFRQNDLVGIVLNSSLIADPTGAPSMYAEQERWLEEELRTARDEGARHLVVFMHHSLFLNDPDEPDEYFNIPRERRDTYLDLLQNAGVRQVFAGHYHRNASGRFKNVEMITSGPVGRPLGEDGSGLRVVTVRGDAIAHEYYEFGAVPNRVELSAGPAAGGQAGEAGDNVLTGAIDIHVHSDPDSVARSIDALDVAALSEKRGLRGIVLKNHYDATAGLAFLARKVAPDLEVFGGVALNRSVGGINPAAVEHMTAVAGDLGRVVWMPTYDAEHHVRSQNEDRPFVSVSRDGRLLPEVVEVIRLVAEHGLVLATGHSAPEESLLLLREARRQGVQQMVVTHPMQMFVGMDVGQMQAAAREGAFLEFVGGNVTDAGAAARLDGFAAAIRQVGPEFCILSSDLGQRGNPLPPDGFADFITALAARGFSDEELDLMSRQNPARLLGLR